MHEAGACFWLHMVCMTAAQSIVRLSRSGGLQRIFAAAGTRSALQISAAMIRRAWHSVMPMISNLPSGFSLVSFMVMQVCGETFPSGQMEPRSSSQVEAGDSTPVVPGFGAVSGAFSAGVGV